MTRMNKLMTGAALVVLGTASLAFAATDAKPMGQRGERPAPMTQMFESFDSDGNGSISREEFAAHGPAAGFSEAYATADADGNGLLEGDELIAFADARKAAREAQQLEMRKARMEQRMLERFDADKDGKLSLEEMQAQGPMGFFDRFDADEDGQVTEDELAAARPMRHEQRGMGQGAGEGMGPKGDRMMRHEGDQRQWHGDRDHDQRGQGFKRGPQNGDGPRDGQGPRGGGMQDFWQY
ncbi:EF-hand domain-containing protein [Alloyangia pacifica]|uniref:Ca2+-binding protein, EF-hand superfamily n=1 Tax=Alloyangia pacifica TaxID=311180 RepID=A0A1I6W260_9RHOB|nr:EF-hand domain-containing protein [Alloyangia pacifica]SDI38495.1 Ca2+-binding protein, EF-hand superfamily [Alloyangia pacifica]SFT20049.1 Ca2+-binding protein, EF-hand superfamily [Alloyangia pacifica]